MAFLDCRDTALHALPNSYHAAALPAAPAPALSHPAALRDLSEQFDPRERRVVALARGDGLDSLREPRKRGWLERFVFGPNPPSPKFANERLEALRRLAVQAWHKGYLLPVSALTAAEAAGFTEHQIGLVVDTIARERSTPRSAPL